MLGENSRRSEREDRDETLFYRHTKFKPLFLSCPKTQGSLFYSVTKFRPPFFIDCLNSALPSLQTLLNMEGFEAENPERMSDV